MSKPIQTYDDMIRERERLEALLKAQGELLKYDITEVKNGVSDSLKNVTKAFTRNTGSMLLTGTTNKLVDVVLRNGLLARAGWIAKLVIPFLVKNYSSHYVAEHKNKWMSKLFSWIGKKNHNGKVAPEQEENKGNSRY